MKKLLTIVGLLSIVAISSCDQTMARKYGGSTKINLPKGQKLVNITWKDSQLWYLTRPMN
jgi:hypothetical protein